MPLETGYLREGYIIFGLKSKKMSLYIIHRMITLLMVRFLGVSSGSHGRFFWGFDFCGFDFARSQQTNQCIGHSSNVWRAWVLRAMVQLTKIDLV